MNRRKFLQNTAAAVALAALAGGKISFAQDGANKLNIVVFWQDGFPTIDGLNLSKDVLQNSLSSHNLIFANVNELSGKLSANIDLFLNPYGSAFPKSAWNVILKYLQTGGNFLNLGGKAFSFPVKKQNGAWQAETEQVNYHKRLGILQYFQIDGNEHDFFESRASGVNSKIKPKRVFETYLRLTSVNDFPDEAGSDGRREAGVVALLFGHKRKPVDLIKPENNSIFNESSMKGFENFVKRINSFPISAPIVEINRLRGEFAGGRWVLVNYEGEIDTETIKSLVINAAFGGFEVTVKPAFACYRENETPELEVNFNAPKGDAEISINVKSVGIVNDKDKNVWSGTVNLQANKPKTVKLEGFKSEPGYLNGGIYYEAVSRRGFRHLLSSSTGFWVYDAKLIASSLPFSADKHFLYRNGQPFPVVGTTYMASDVARRFLLEPNPYFWNNDFDEMKAAGVNLIRTGIWTAWNLYFDEKGEVKEEVLRAFEAFILTARKYDIPVIFTFFAFLPEMFGGRNPYLDPQSIKGQKRFLAVFASRVKTAKDVIWDLINEPSFANPKNLWSCRPNYDEFERAAWRDWLKKRFAENDETKLADILREKWRLTGEENPFELPKMEDFDAVNIFSNRRPLKTLDFRLFAQDVFADWAREMSKTLKEAGNSAQMVTVGQDEAGTGDSPAPQFHTDAVDFTCLHNWWSNDDLLWDNVVSKSPQKPNLVEETGVMFYEKLDGAAWRDEQTVANLLERKMALALGANACGFVEWIWNTNPFMNIDNEAGIGFLRVDGTAKPELAAFRKIARFANENRQFFKGKETEKILLVIPHSYQFTPRSLAGEATRKAVRVFHYHTRRTMQAVSEYAIESVAEIPALIILPSARTLSQKAWLALLKKVEAGSILAVTGFIEEDEYFLPVQRLGEHFSIDGAIPVGQTETVLIEGKKYQVRFAGEKIQRVERAAFPQNYIANVQIGAGEILWCRVPLEIGETPEPVAAFYNFALKRAKLLPYFSLKNDNPAILVRPTEFAGTVLYTIVSESANDEFIELTHLGTGTKIEFMLPNGRTNLIFVDKKTGRVLSRMG